MHGRAAAASVAMTCHKKAYPSYQHAINDARGVTRKAERGQGAGAFVYKCRHCHEWHVGTHMPLLKYRPKAKRRPRVVVDGD